MQMKNSDAVRSLVPGLVGPLAGLLAGNRLIKTYDSRTE